MMSQVKAAGAPVIPSDRKHTNNDKTDKVSTVWNNLNGAQKCVLGGCFTVAFEGGAGLIYGINRLFSGVGDSRITFLVDILALLMALVPVMIFASTCGVPAAAGKNRTWKAEQQV